MLWVKLKDPMGNCDHCHSRDISTDDRLHLAAVPHLRTERRQSSDTSLRRKGHHAAGIRSQDLHRRIGGAQGEAICSFCR